MNNRANLHRIILSGLTILGAGGICTAADCFSELVPDKGPGMQPMLHDVRLDGVAAGGELILLEMLNPSPRYISIVTQPGETAEVVITRMADAINKVSPFNPGRARAQVRNARGELVPGHTQPIVRPEGKLLKSFGGLPGSYVFAGTETGLGIPPPPTSLSVSYSPESQEVSLFWENPDAPYDAVKANIGAVLPGTASSVGTRQPPPKYEAPRRNVISRSRDRDNAGLRRFYVIGCRQGVLSSPAVITLNYRTGAQEELDSQPFAGGVAPNWKAWSRGGKADMLVLEQGTKGEQRRFDRAPQAALQPDDKTFFQRIKTGSPDVI